MEHMDFILRKNYTYHLKQAPPSVKANRHKDGVGKASPAPFNNLDGIHPGNPNVIGGDSSMSLRDPLVYLDFKHSCTIAFFQQKYTTKSFYWCNPPTTSSIHLLLC